MAASKIFAALLAKMPSAQREAYFAQLPKKDTSQDAIALPQAVTVVQVPHLPVRAVTSQLTLARSVVNQQRVRRDQLATEVLRTNFGNQVPHVDI